MTVHSPTSGENKHSWSSRGAEHDPGRANNSESAIKVAGTSFLARGVDHHRASRVSNTHDRVARFRTRKDQTNMAARGFFPARCKLVLETKFAHKGGFNC